MDVIKVEDFFVNDFMKIWIAPIITAIMSGIFLYTFKKRKEVKRQITTMEAAEKDFINLIRPFYIKPIGLRKITVIDIRKEVLRKYSLNENQLIDYNSLKNAITYDIIETRFINEDEKIKLIDFLENDLSWTRGAHLIKKGDSYDSLLKNEHRLKIIQKIVIILYGYFLLIIFYSKFGYDFDMTMPTLCVMSFVSALIINELRFSINLKFRNNKKEKRPEE